MPFDPPAIDIAIFSSAHPTAQRIHLDFRPRPRPFLSARLGQAHTFKSKQFLEVSMLERRKLQVVQQELVKLSIPQKYQQSLKPRGFYKQNFR
jgi:hypothetical protein